MVIGTALGTLLSCDHTPDSTSGVTTQPVQAEHHRELRQIFNHYDYSWETLDNGVPPLILSQFPEDLQLIQSPQRKKRLFFLSLLPMALLANEEINTQRRTLLELLSFYDTFGSLDADQQGNLERIQDYYRVKGDPLTEPKSRHTLLRRVDIVPPAMILAQAANESGWGSSRFAQQGNNLFGEWTFTPGRGLVPEGRPEGETYEVRRFKSLYHSIRSYTRNINTHWAYLPLRNLRADLRAKGESITGLKLAGELDLYSTRRDDYSRDIISLIRSNRLEQLATVRLRPETVSLDEIQAEDSTGFGLFSSRALLWEATPLTRLTAAETRAD